MSSTNRNFVVSSDSDEDIPLAAKLKSFHKNEDQKRALPNSNDSDDDDDIPLATKLSLSKQQQQKSEDAKSKTPVERSNNTSSAPKKLKKESSNSIGTTNGKGKTKPSSSIDDTIPLRVVTIADKPDDSFTQPPLPTKSSKTATKKAKKESGKSEQEDVTEDDDGEHRWWEDPSFLEDGSVKWTTLEHNGVLFPPEYIPHGIPLVYNGQDIVLPGEVEEVAGFFAALLETEHAQNEIFVNNFWSDFRALLQEKYQSLADRIVKFECCDFGKMHRYFNEIKEAKKSLTKEEKAKIKQDKMTQEEKYMHCQLDGRKERVGNFRVEPPGLFRGRGKHPKAGKLKARVVPEQVTINIGKGAPIPEPPAGHTWGRVIHNNEVAWLACWIENINGSYKYVLFAANSSLKGQSDFKKFEKARELKKHIDRIRKTIQTELDDEKLPTKQRATALWLIDVLALRAGNEKGEDEADTVGCCSLRVEHVKFEEPNFVIFDFLGKDSIRYYNRVGVESKIFRNLKLFARKKEPSEMLFDKLTTSSLNNYLDNCMSGLTAKVFRTFNASFTFQRLLNETPSDLPTVHDKMLAYNRSNREVAVLCNHQRAIPKTHHTSISKLKEKVDLAKLQRHRIKQALRDALPVATLKEYEQSGMLDEESDFDDETIAQIEELEIKVENEKAEKALQKKLANASHSQDHSTQDSNVDSASQQQQQQHEQSSQLEHADHVKNSHSFNSLPIDKLEKTLEKFNSKIGALKTQLIDRDENKTTSLGTSKINYLDPRISVAWCKKHSVPIEKIFSKTLRDKFRWALAVDSKWTF